MEKEEQNNSVEFYKKRYEIHAKLNMTLKEENQVLRKELDSIKKVVTGIMLPKEKKGSKEIQNNDNLRQILEFQHNRIETLERENLEMKKKYEKLLFEQDQKSSENDFEEKANFEGKSKTLFAKYHENTDELKQANKTIMMLENKLKELQTNYAKEIIDLKTKLTTQTASMIINKKDVPVNNDFRVHSADPENKQDFLFKKKDNLQPLEKSTHKLQNRSMFEQNSMFNYSKTLNNK